MIRPSRLPPLSDAHLCALADRGARLLALTTPPVRPALEQPAAVRELAERAVDDRADVLGGGVGRGHAVNVRADVRAGE